MRIGILTGEYPPLKGGVGDYTYCLSEAFTHLGHEVFILSRHTAQDTRPHIHMSNTLATWGLRAVGHIRHWIQTNQLDVLNIQYQTAIYDMSAWVHFLPRLLPIPVVTTFHDLLFPYLFPKAGAVRPWIVRELARTSAQAIVTNQEDFAKLQNLSPQLIPIGSNIQVIAPTEAQKVQLYAEYAVQKGDFWVAHFGFPYPNRGIEYLIEAIAHLRQEGLPIRLVFIGGREGGPSIKEYVTHLDEQVAKWDLQDYVNWTGFLASERVSTLLQSVDSVVLPFLDGASYRRGTLMAAIEHACPIITTIPNMPISTFRDGENMLLVPVGDAHAITDRLRHLYYDVRLRQKLREQVALLRSEFQWDTIAKDFVDVFQSVYSHKK